MDERFIVGKRYKFDAMKYILLECIDDLMENMSWIEICSDDFEVEESNIYNDGTDYLYNNLFALGIEWCVCLDDKVQYLGMIEDTYGASVVIYRDENGKIKTKHYKLFKELLEKELTYK